MNKGKRIFAGVYPCGIVFADRHNEQHGDYKRLAFLPYRTLALELEKDCPPELVAPIQRQIAALNLKAGELFEVSTSGQTVRLGQ